MEEVFSRQTKEVQDFLLATSILDRFCAPLCASVLEILQPGQDDTAGRVRKMLEQIEHSNLFLIPLDYQRNWFRYHHLFSDLLRHTASQVFPNITALLHLRASQWLEAHGYIQEAVKHGFQSQDWPYAAELVERHAWNQILHSQVSTTSEWCRTFPEAVIRKRPALCIFHAWALIIAFKKDDFPAATARIQQAEAALGEIDPQVVSDLIPGAPPVPLHTWVNGQVTLLRSFLLMAAPRAQANPQALVDLGRLSYDLLPEGDIPGRSASLLDICYASQARCDADEAEENFKHTIGVALSGGNYFGAVVAEYHRAHGLLAQGRLRDVVAFCQDKKAQYQSYFAHPIQEMPAIALLDQAMGCALLELNQLEDAGAYLRSGLEVGQWMPREELPGYLALARFYATQGDDAGMLESLRRLDMRWPDISYCTQAERILYRLKKQPEDHEARLAAEAWVEKNPPLIREGVVIPGIGPAWNDEADYSVYIGWAQVQILLGHPEAALEVIQPILDVAQKYRLLHRVIHLTLLQAQAEFTQGRREDALRLARSTLEQAEPLGYLRLLDQGPVAAQLLREACRQGIAPVYIPRLFEACGLALKSSAPAHLAENTLANDLVEPLSSREIEVLALMDKGLSNAEIAAKLYLSTNTLKAHTQNIYGKLDVHSRVQALNRARELKIF
ncbi:MAG TPA: LuxR C-terminal-related transcriptional regulator, partial [Anaerolinea sp.]|nr:LuxR C-terminal-related transcriptional regulator [Anaerolinea sp.]